MQSNALVAGSPEPMASEAGTPAPTAAPLGRTGPIVTTTRKCANCGMVGHIKTNKKYVVPVPLLRDQWLASGLITKLTTQLNLDYARCSTARSSQRTMPVCMVGLARLVHRGKHRHCRRLRPPWGDWRVVCVHQVGGQAGKGKEKQGICCCWGCFSFLFFFFFFPVGALVGAEGEMGMRLRMPSE